MNSVLVFLEQHAQLAAICVASISIVGIVVRWFLDAPERSRRASMEERDHAVRARAVALEHAVRTEALALDELKAAIDAGHIMRDELRLERDVARQEMVQARETFRNEMERERQTFQEEITAQRDAMLREQHALTEQLAESHRTVDTLRAQLKATMVSMRRLGLEVERLQTQACARSAECPDRAPVLVVEAKTKPMPRRRTHGAGKGT